MNTTELLSAIRSDEYLSKKCLGVFPSDRVPKLQPDTCVILNEDSHDKPGSHWLAMYKSRVSTEWFDTFGRPPLPLFNSIVTTYNKQQIQSPFSDTCGAHCLFYLYHRARKIPARDVFHFYCSDKVQNDIYVSDFVYTHFNLHCSVRCDCKRGCINGSAFSSNRCHLRS